MIKRICSLILVVCMSLGAVSALAYDDVNNDKQKTAVGLITGFGIMDGVNEKEFGSDMLVKRGEFALYAARLFGNDVKPSASGKGYFDDVDTTTPEGAAVEFLASVGLIEKKGREYNPNDEITYAEAIRVLLNGLGYADVAKSRGGYPGGYIRTATDCELNSNVWLMTNSVLKKTEAAQLLYNALLVYPMQSNGYKADDKTLLESKWDVDEISGIVEAYEDTAIGSNKTLPDNTVQIGGETFDAGNTNIGKYIGYSVKAFYRDDSTSGERTIVSFTEKNNSNTVITCSAEDVEVSGNNVSIYKDKTRKTQKIVNSPAVIYNGQYITNYSALEDVLNIKEGEITFIANDGSTKANVIIVTEYKHLLIDRVDKKAGRLYIKNGSPSVLDDVITVKPEENDVTVFIDGKQAEFNDIQPDDAVTMIMSPDGEKFTLEVSRATVTGKITSKTTDKIKIDDTEYELSAYSTDKLNVSTEGVFAMTMDGKLLGLVAGTKSSSNNYAYVINVYNDKEAGQAFVKLYTANGELETYECAANVNVNGQRRNYIAIPNYVKKSELVTYALNSAGKIMRINRPYDTSSNIDYVNETEFIKNWNKSSVRYIDGIMGMSLVTEDTLIFSMPRYDRNNSSDYRLLKMSDLKNRTYADVTCYDIDRQGRIGALLIVEDISDSVTMSNSLFFVKSVSNAVNDEDEQIARIEGYQDGKEVTLDFTEDTSCITYEDGWMNYVGNEDFDKNYGAAIPGEMLNVGDAIQYTLDNDGDVSAFRLVYNNEKTVFDANNQLKDDNDLIEARYEDWSGTGSVTKQDFYDDLYISFGTVKARYLDYMLNIGLKESEVINYPNSMIIDYYRPINLKNAPIYVYKVKQRELELGDIEDISKDDFVFVRSKKMGELNEVMVYSFE